LGNIIVFSGLAMAVFVRDLPLDLQFLPCFHLGLLILKVRDEWPKVFNSWIGSGLFLLGVAGCFSSPIIMVGSGAARTWSIYDIREWMGLELVSCFLLLGYVTSVHGGLVFRFLTANTVRFLGRISYSLYLLHLPIVFVAHGLIQRYEPDWFSSSFGVVVSTIVTLVVTIPLATVLYYFVERPFVRAGRDIARLITSIKPRGHPVDVAHTTQTEAARFGE
jgi:peptidoglycan/LPS O-acetylase OafA/YrhL